MKKSCVHPSLLHSHILKSFTIKFDLCLAWYWFDSNASCLVFMDDGGWSSFYLHMDPGPVSGEDFCFATRIYAISHPRWIFWLNLFPFWTREIQFMSVAFTCVLVMTSQYINITRRSSCVELLSTFCCVPKQTPLCYSSISVACFKYLSIC